MRKATLREAQFVMLDILKEVDRICKKNNISYWLESGTLLGAIRHDGFIPWDDDLDIGMLRKDYNRFIEIVNSDLNKRYFCQTPLTDEYAENAFIKIRDLNSEIKSANNYGRYNGLFIDIFPYDSAISKNIKTKKAVNFKILSKWFGDLDFKKPYIANLKKNSIIFLCKSNRMFEVFYPYKKTLKRAYYKGLNAEITNTEKIVYGIEVPFNNKFDLKDIFPLRTHKFEGMEAPVPKAYEKILEEFYGDWRKLPEVKNQVPSHSNNILLKD